MKYMDVQIIPEFCKIKLLNKNVLLATEQEFLGVKAEGDVIKDAYLWSQGVMAHVQPKASEEGSLGK